MIETERLMLREYSMDDLDALFEIVGDEETMRHYPAPFSREKAKGWIEWNIRNYETYGFGLWAVVLKETCTFIGDCGVTIQNINGSDLPEIGYHINKRFWRQGFAREAAGAVRDWMFSNTGFDVIYSYMKYTNAASIATAVANGMRKVDEFPNLVDGVSYVYAITRDEWKGLKGLVSS